MPTGRDTRPTSDRAREGLFSTVQALLGSLAGARVADLYAGSGAVGLEALSRGAAHALLVEAHPKAARVIRDNVAALGLSGAELRSDRVERVVAQAPDAPYDLIFADPPYAVTDAEIVTLLEALRDHGWPAAEGLVAVERPTRGSAVAWPAGYTAARERKYGEATFWYGWYGPGA